jgi:hypothetical protein
VSLGRRILLYHRITVGLHIHALGELPANAERSYYVYLLDYGWEEPLGQALRANFERMAEEASQADAVVIRGPRAVHFEDQVLSWHHVNGVDAADILPAILVTTRHPTTFRESHGPPPQGTPVVTDALLLIPLKRVCKTAQDVADLIQQLFVEIRAKTPLTKFRIVKQMQFGRGRALVDAVVLEPNIAGVGLDIKKVLTALFGKRTDRDPAA